MYPVDIVRALKMASASGPSVTTGQIITNFYQNHGIKGLFSKGLIPEMARATLSRSIKFFVQPIAHETFFNKKET